MANLYDLMKNKVHLESQLEDADTFTQELEAIWEDNNIELKAKIDAYGYVLDTIDKDVQFLKAKKTKLNDIQKHLEKEKEKIKTRLNNIANGEPLRGNEYSFHPFTSRVTDHIEENLVEPEYKTYSATMNWHQMMLVKHLFSDTPATFDIAENDKAKEEIIWKENVSVSGLPENHPAIVYKITPSVRIK